MRILQLHTRYRQHGGEEVVVATEGQALRDAGHVVTSYHIDNPGGAEAAAAFLLAPWNPLQAAVVRRLAARLHPDVAHVHNTWFAMSPAVLAALHQSGIPVVLTLHNYRLMCSNAMLFRSGAPCELCVGTHPWHGVRYRCYRGTAGSLVAAGTIALNRRLGTWERHVDLFIALTEFAKGRLTAGGYPPDRIIVKPNFVPDPGQRYNPPSGSRDVLLVGRLSDEKGVGLLLDAWRQFGSSELRLVVAGDGPMHGQLAAQDDGSVAFLGRVEPARVRELMLSARALVFPSKWYEGMPMVLLEALASGLPVLAADLGGISEVVGRLGPDWQVADPNSTTWAEALRLLHHGPACDRASHAARAAYEDRFMPERGVAALEACYDRALNSFRTR